MSMPITVHIVDSNSGKKDIDVVFDYFKYVDEKFSVFKEISEITKINKGLLNESEYSDDMKEVFELSEKTKKETNGYFDIFSPKKNIIDPSGLVKGWAIHNATKILSDRGIKNFYIEAGGDIEVAGKNKKGEDWNIGIRDPFSKTVRIIKRVSLKNEGIATSGTYIRGQHIYDPFEKGKEFKEIVSLSVIGPNVYEADRFATAAFAMGKEGIMFIERLKGFEGYMIDKAGIATMTTGFEKYVIK